jgi:mono/diheme cytochrome c family protein
LIEGGGRGRHSLCGWRSLSVALLGLAFAGCGGSEPADTAPGGAGATASVTAAPVASAAAPATVADLFPPGDGREPLLSNCANCHAVACAAMGQRTEPRWREIEEAHDSHVPGLPEADRQRIFAYLRANFNESRPEPTIPPEFLDRGCTPF